MKSLLQVACAVFLVLSTQNPVMAKSKKEIASSKCGTAHDLCVANECAILSTPDAKDQCINSCDSKRNRCVKKADKLSTGVNPGTGGATRQPTLSRD